MDKQKNIDIARGVLGSALPTSASDDLARQLKLAEQARSVLGHVTQANAITDILKGSGIAADAVAQARLAAGLFKQAGSIADLAAQGEPQRQIAQILSGAFPNGFPETRSPIADAAIGKLAGYSGAPAYPGRTTPLARHAAAEAGVAAPGPSSAITSSAITSTVEIGALVRVARRRLKLNQQRFADLAGVGRRFVSELEAGKPSLEIGKVLRCCAALGIDLFARQRSE